MTITLMRLQHRPDANIPFFNEITNPSAIQAAVRDQFAQNLYADGKVTITPTLSEDNLTQSNIIVIDSLESYSQFSTMETAEIISLRHQYSIDNGFYTTPAEFGNVTSFQQTGISNTFTVTTGYSFPTANVNLIDSIQSSINAKSTKVSNVTVTETGLTVIHTYNNSEDYTANYWLDFNFAKSLAENNVTRTIQYAYVA